MAELPEDPHKIGFVDIERWAGSDHRHCEAPRHAGLNLPAVAVIARDMPGSWRLPGFYDHV